MTRYYAIVEYSSRTAIWRVTLKHIPNPPLFDVPAQGNRLEFLDETYPQKLEGWSYSMLKIATSTVFEILATRKSPILPTVTLKPGSGVTQGH